MALLDVLLVERTQWIQVNAVQITFAGPTGLAAYTFQRKHLAIGMFGQCKPLFVFLKSDL